MPIPQLPALRTVLSGITSWRCC